MNLSLNSVALHKKITILVCLVAVIISTALGYYAYSRIYALSYEKAINKLGTDTRLMSSQVTSAFTRIYDDLQIISRTPPFQGLIRSSTNDGTDPLDGSSVTLWKARLSEIFSSVMLERPHYMQMRFIGIADNGRELVRVNNSNGGLQIVEDALLQQKGGEEYMADLDQLSNREIYFSNVTFNKEHGKIDSMRLPTLRAITPIFDGDKLFGIFIININYPVFITELVHGFLPKHEMYVVNNQRDYLKVESDGTTGEFEFHLAYSQAPPDFIKELNFETDDGVFSEDREDIAYYSTINIPGHEEMKHFGVVFQADYQVIMSNALELRNQSLLLSLFFILLSGLTAYVFARKFTGPIRQMSKAIAGFKHINDAISLPEATSLEMKELIDAFELAMNHIKESQDMANVILETANDGIISINSEGIINRYNHSAEKIFGCSAKEVIGENVKKLMPADHAENHDMYLNNYLESGISSLLGKEREFRGVHKTGYGIPLAVSISEVNTKEGKEFTAIIRDLTYRKETENKLQQLLSDLQRSNRDLDEFAYVASHDLKAPLRVIDNASSWLQEDLEEHLDEESRENLSLLRSRVKRMEKLLDDLLEYSRVGKKKDQSYDEEVSAKLLLDEILFMLAPPEGFTIEADDAFFQITLRRMPVYQILYNLINNAIKHHDSQTGRIQIYLTEKDGLTICNVSDDGPGIDPRFHEKIFQVFQTLKPRDQVEGSGMGLSIIKKHVESYNGILGIISEPDRGANFWFSLPADEEVSKYDHNQAIS